MVSVPLTPALRHFFQGFPYPVLVIDDQYRQTYPLDLIFIQYRQMYLNKHAVSIGVVVDAETCLCFQFDVEQVYPVLDDLAGTADMPAACSNSNASQPLPLSMIRINNSCPAISKTDRNKARVIDTRESNVRCCFSKKGCRIVDGSARSSISPVPCRPVFH